MPQNSIEDIIKADKKYYMNTFGDRVPLSFVSGSGIELMGTGGVVPLKLVVNLGRGLELLLQAVGPDQGGGAVHLIEIPDLLGDGDVGGVVVQLLLHQLLAEHPAQLLGGHGLEGTRIQQGGGLVLHVRAQVVPSLGHLAFFEIDFVGDRVCHFGFSFRRLPARKQKEKPPPDNK